MKPESDVGLIHCSIFAAATLTAVACTTVAQLSNRYEDVPIFPALRNSRPWSDR
jgi:hypothetical protein